MHLGYRAPLAVLGDGVTFGDFGTRVTPPRPKARTSETLSKGCPTFMALAPAFVQLSMGCLVRVVTPR